MKKVFIIFTLLFLTCQVVLADSITIGITGKTWNNLGEGSITSSEKRYYETLKEFLIRGIYEGVFLSTDKTLKSSYASKGDWSSLASAVDEFYEDNKNEQVPLVYALSIVGMQVNGKDPDSIENTLKGLREKSRQLFKAIR
jgi:CTP-dependent riboflavin kinase